MLVLLQETLMAIESMLNFLRAQDTQTGPLTGLLSSIQLMVAGSHGASCITKDLNIVWNMGKIKLLVAQHMLTDATERTGSYGEK